MGANTPGWTRRMCAACIAIGLVVTLSVTFVPGLRFSYRNPGLHVVLDTAEALIGFLVAYVMYGRFRSSRRAGDLALVLGLSLLGVSNLLFSVVPVVALGEAGEAFATWAPSGTRFIGAVSFATGAAFPARIRVSHRAARIAAIVFAAVVVSFIAVMVATASELPAALDEGLDLGASQRVAVVGHPLLLAAQVGMMILYGSAAGAFLRRAQDPGPRIYGWFGAASILAAFARLNYLLFPSLYSDFVYVGDAFRLGFYVVLLVGSAEEIRSHWEARAEAEVFRVRNLLARRLHDGLAQELVFISAQTRRLLREGGKTADLELLNSASDRAVAEARRSIAALSRRLDEPLEEAIAETAEEEARRTGSSLRLVLQEGVQIDADQREALVRIAREAVKNAARHANATLITVVLEASDGIHLTVRDDGVGWTTRSSGTRPGAMGLVMMRERVEAMGGELTISDAEGGGTEVKVFAPWKE